MTNKQELPVINQYDEHYVLPWLEQPSQHTNGPTKYMSVKSEDIIIVIPRSKRAFQTKKNLDIILELIKELNNDEQ